jgi:excisionase family DNA binding protein
MANTGFDSVEFEEAHMAANELAADLMTVAETAKLLKRSTEQVRRYLREGDLPGRRLGGQWFVDRDDAETFARQRRDGTEFLRRLAASDPDPLREVIAIGGSGGADIAGGRSHYFRSLAADARG